MLYLIILYIVCTRLKTKHDKKLQNTPVLQQTKEYSTLSRGKTKCMSNESIEKFCHREFTLLKQGVTTRKRF